MPPAIRVLIVDDSPIVRRVLSEHLARQPGIEVVGSAPDPYVAREQIIALEPDVITLDIEMPRMDGLSFLKKLMRFHPVPTIILSSLAARGTETVFQCLEAGAVEVLAKPSGASSIADVAARLGDIIRGIKDVRLSPSPATASPRTPRCAPTAVRDPSPSHKLIAIGASTGGTEALRAVLSRLPTSIPGLAVVQHMPAGFTNAFAIRLNGLCEIEVREAADGDRICTGLALIAPGEKQMKVVRDGSTWMVRVFDGPRVCRHRPSVEVLFESTAEAARARAMGVIMTGMGADGARGLCSMRKAGAYTLAQDKDSCVVFGMPREAIEAGAACAVAPLDNIHRHIIDYSEGRLRAAG